MQSANDVLLTRFEVARIVGLRSLQLSCGWQPKIAVRDASLREDTMYVAALELRKGLLEAKVVREDGSVIHVHNAITPQCLDITLDSRDGGHRSMQTHP